MATQILSPLNPSAFNLVIDTLKYPNAQFSIQTAALPDLTATGAPLNTPKRNITQMPDKISYGSFTCAFLVDENMLNYEEIHDWMLDLVEWEPMMKVQIKLGIWYYKYVIVITTSSKKFNLLMRTPSI